MVLGGGVARFSKNLKLLCWLLFSQSLLFLKYYLNYKFGLISKSRFGVCSMLENNFRFFICRFSIPSFSPCSSPSRRCGPGLLNSCPRPSAVHLRCASSSVPDCPTYSKLPQFSSEYYTSHRSFTKHDNKILITAAALCRHIYIPLWRGFPLHSSVPTATHLAAPSSDQEGAHSLKWINALVELAGFVVGVREACDWWY